MATSKEELEAYREKVFQELRSRARRLKELDGAIASVNYLLEVSRSSRALRSGDTLRALAGASRRAKLVRDSECLQQQRREAGEDFKRAEERLADVDRELSQLDELDASQIGEPIKEQEK